MKTEIRLRISLTLKFMLFVSLFGLLTTLLLTVDPPTPWADFSVRGPLIGSTFMLICAVGIIAALRPRKCSMAFGSHVSNVTFNQESKITPLVGSRAHHPDCGRFSTHTVRFRRTSHCSACTGLALGASIALAMSAYHFLFGFKMPGFSLAYVAVGQLGPVLGFIQFKLKSWLRTAANAFFVFGSSLILIGMDQQISSLVVDAYMIGLIVLWIITRVAISQWDHSRICLICNYQCK